jgi:hypothetical protein
MSILSATRPEDLFPGDIAEAKKVYHALAKRWHPDASGGDSKTFAHVSALYDKALTLLAEGRWDGSTTIHLPLKTSGVRTVSYYALRPFELGLAYIGDNHVTYLLDTSHKDLYEQARIALSRFKYGSAKMQADIERCLPHKAVWFETPTQLGVAIEKKPSLLLLRDVLNHLKNIDVRHIAWIQNTLHNLTCYLSYINVMHGDISLDTYYIDPETHSGALLGGWWYARPLGQDLKKVTARTASLLPWSVRRDKKATVSVDLECVKAMGLEQGVTDPKLVKWLKSVATQDAIKTYKAWGTVLEERFGPRRFVEMKLTAQDLYRL